MHGGIYRCTGIYFFKSALQMYKRCFKTDSYVAVYNKSLYFLHFS